MKKINKLYSIIIIIILILSICSNVIATTGDYYKKYKDKDLSSYTAEELKSIIDKLTEERNYWATQGLLGEQEYASYNTLITNVQKSADNKNNVTGPTDDELKKYTADEILAYFDKYPDASGLSDAVKQKWQNTLKNANYTDQNKKSKVYNILKDKLGVEVGEAINDSGVNTGDGKDKNGNNGPSTGTLGSSDASASHTLGEITSEAKGFLGKGTLAIPFGMANLKPASDTLFNILLGLGIAGAVIVGLYLGIKFMMSTVEDKAKVKEALIPYIVGCVIIFGAFIIWKLAVLLLQNIG